MQILTNMANYYSKMVKMLMAEVQMAEKNRAEWLKWPKTANSANISKNIKKD
jgi:hypothetical protein